MDEATHKAKHKELHKALDELVTDYLQNTGGRTSQRSVIDLIEWSHKQTLKPDHKNGE